MYSLPYRCFVSCILPPLALSIVLGCQSGAYGQSPVSAEQNGASKQAQNATSASNSNSAVKSNSAIKSNSAKSSAPKVVPSGQSNSTSQASGKSSSASAGSGAKAARVVEAGSAQGLVRNIDNNKVVTEARVVVRHSEGKHEQQDMLTNSDGVFSFRNLPVGDWILTVTADGMFAYSDKFTVLANESKQLKIDMESVEGYEILRITGKRTLIHPDQIGSRTHINKMLLHDIGDGNNLQQVLNTTPGVLPDTAGNIIVRGEHNSLNYVVDGAVLPEAAGVLQQAQFASPRSLQSVDVDIGGYQARDGGGPLGAVVRMKSMPVQDKPVFEYGSQLGGPLNGGVNYYASSALSQDKNSKWNRVAAESSGSVYSTLLGTQPPTVQFRRNGRLDMNLLSKVVYRPTDKDTLKLILGINETFMHQPTPVISANVGVKLNEHDAANYLIGHYNHQFSKWFDQSNFYVVNSFYTQKLTSSNVFDPQPIINGDGLLQSVAPYGKRKNYALSLQGDISKTAFKSHHLLAGFLSEFRPVSTFYNGTYRNADTTATLNAVADANGQIGDTRNQINSTNQQIFSTQQGILASTLAGDTDTADALTDSLGDLQASLSDLNSQLNSINPNPFPLGQVVSPFTGQAGGPQLQGNVGKFKAFRLLQSAYLQDSWTPNKGFLKRLTVDAGVRADVYYGFFGNTLRLAQLLASTPGVPFFDINQFKSQKVGNAQASGRYGASFALTKNTVLRGSYSQIFQPPPVDLLVRPFNINDGPQPNGQWNGAIKPMHATRGKLIDTSIETQLGPRFVARTNLFYKHLLDVGDELPINNTLLYQRLTLSALEAYGVEQRIDMKPSKEGQGFYGYLSNTVSANYLRGTKRDTGGIYDIDPTPPDEKYIDHDRRESGTAALGYRTKNFWILPNMTVWSGFLDGRDPAIYGPHPPRSPVLTLFNVNAGYNIPKDKKNKSSRLMPTAIELRVQNLLNSRAPINLGSPYQGTRYTLPFRFIVGMNWSV